MPGYAASEEAGRPIVPVKVVLLGVPPGVNIRLDAQGQDVSEAPMRAPLCLAGGDAAAPAAETTERGVYPAQVARLVDLGFARSQRLVRLEIMPVQVDAGAGKILVHDQVRVALRFEGEAGPVGTIAELASFEAVMRQSLLNYEVAKAWRAAPAAATAGLAWTPPQPAYKVLVKETGLYALTKAALAAAGVPVDTVDPRTLKLFNTGQELAILVSGEGDGHFDEADTLLFYGHGVNTRYTDTNVYWLTYGGGEGRRMATVASLGTGIDALSYTATLHQERDSDYVSTLPKLPGYDHWYGPKIQPVGAGNVRWRDYAFATTALAPGNYTARIRARLGGLGSNSTHHIRLYAGDQKVLDTTWNYQTVYLAENDFAQSYLTEGTSTIRLEVVNDTPGQVSDIVYPDWIDVLYQRQLVASNDSLRFAGPETGARQYQISGFTAAPAEVYDVTDDANVAVISGAEIAPDGGGFRLRFAVNQEQPRTYLALASSRRLSPVAIVADTPSNLQDPANGADYLVLAYGDFIPALQPLLDLRASQGMRVKVVDVQDIYDEFNYGAMSAEAIRDFVAYAYANWQGPAVSDLLLVGDGTYDFRHYLPTSANTYVPPYLAMVDPEVGETAADNRFAAISGADVLPDVNIGRLPANSAAETTAMVNKILTYEGVSPEAAWTKRVVFATDNLEGGGGNFYDLSDQLADGPADPPNQDKKLLPDTYERRKIYMGRTCPTENPSSVVCRNQLLDDLSSTGALLVSYIGHGTKTFWAAERLLDIEGITSLQNAGRLPIMLPMTCDEGYFIMPEVGAESTSEAGIRLPERGTIASYAPTGFGLSSGHDYLERGLFQALFHDQTALLGAATTASKYYLVANAPPGKYLDLIDTFLLMGDPALHVPLTASGSTDLFLPLLKRSE